MNTETKIKVTQIQRYCMHDGPGIRTTVFFKGCPLNCDWCHNPETKKAHSQVLFYCLEACQNSAHVFLENHVYNREKCSLCLSCPESCPSGALELCGKDMTIEEILSEAEKDRAFYGEKGGITLSGGEPFFQGEKAVELLKECKKRGLSTAVETCGYADRETLLRASKFTDLFLWDLKDTNVERHKTYTGASNKKILSNLFALNKTKARIRLRCILVKGINTDKSHYEKIADIALEIDNLEGVEFIPYHAYAGTKASFLGKEDNGKTVWIPEASDLDTAICTLAEKGIKTRRRKCLQRKAS